MGDIQSAVNYVVSHASQWKIRKNKFILWGGSAGGHLAMLFAYAYDSTRVVSSVISLGGPTKLDDRHSIELSSGGETLLPLITGAKWSNESFADAYRYASPYYGRHLKPTLIMHGGADTIVSNLQAVLMADQLSASGIPHQLFIIAHGAHGGEGASVPVQDSANQAINNWIERYGH